MTFFSDKMNQLGAVIFDAEISTDVTSFDNCIFNNLPNDYLSYLSEFHRTIIFRKKVCFSGINTSPWAYDGMEELEVIYSSSKNTNNNLYSLNKTSRDKVPEGFFIIGQATGANYILLRTEKDNFGCVYLFDHEGYGSEEENTYLLQTSFTNFINSLTVVDEEIKNDSKLVSLDLSESLKDKINKILKNKNL